MMYIIILALVAFPTTMFGGSTPMDCSLCNPNMTNCGLKTLGLLDEEQISKFAEKIKEDGEPKHNAWWVKKFCTQNSVDGFTLYFPYFLLMVPIFMVAIEKGFVKYVYIDTKVNLIMQLLYAYLDDLKRKKLFNFRIFKAGMKLESFYNLVVRDVTSSGDGTADFVENRKDIIELSQSFRNKSNFYYSYVFRTVMEVAISVVFLAVLIVFGIPETLAVRIFNGI